MSLIQRLTWRRERKQARVLAGSGNLSNEDVEGLRRSIADRQAPSLRRDLGRPPTSEEKVLAAWGNLAVEEPAIKIEDVRDALALSQ